MGGGFRKPTGTSALASRNGPGRFRAQAAPARRGVILAKLRLENRVINILPLAHSTKHGERRLSFSP